MHEGHTTREFYYDSEMPSTCDLHQATRYQTRFEAQGAWNDRCRDESWLTGRAVAPHIRELRTTFTEVFLITLTNN